MIPFPTDVPVRAVQAGRVPRGVRRGVRAERHLQDRAPHRALRLPVPRQGGPRLQLRGHDGEVSGWGTFLITSLDFTLICRTDKTTQRFLKKPQIFQIHMSL